MNMTLSDERFEYQSRLYEFPYHYLASLEGGETIAIHRFYPWGLDYMTYMTFVVELISERLKVQSLLDVGCGDGRLVNLLNGKVPRLAGVDPDERPILFARAFNPQANFYAGDLSQVPGQFQAASLIEVMEHIPDDQYPEFIRQIRERIQPGGKLVVSVPTTNMPLNKKHYRHYHLELLQSQLAPFFEIENHWYLSRLGFRFWLFKRSLQNVFGIVLSGKWRRLIWRLHRRYSYLAGPKDGRHLVAVARLTNLGY